MFRCHPPCCDPGIIRPGHHYQDDLQPAPGLQHLLCPKLPRNWVFHTLDLLRPDWAEEDGLIHQESIYNKTKTNGLLSFSQIHTIGRLSPRRHIGIWLKSREYPCSREIYLSLLTRSPARASRGAHDAQGWEEMTEHVSCIPTELRWCNPQFKMAFGFCKFTGW